MRGPGCLLTVLLTLWCVNDAHATTILSPVGSTQNTFGEFPGGCCPISKTFDQSGLSINFVSGVTDFDAYIASGPLHSLVFNTEWFPPAGGPAQGTIDYDLGASFLIDRLALWNEDAVGITRMTVFTSNDPGFGVSVNVGTFFPVDNPLGLDYPAEVLSLVLSTGRYVRLQIQGADEFGFGASMGEIAFSTLPVTEPGTVGFLGLGLTGLWLLRRRREAPRD